MAADLYADWLGISSGKRPPDHFALLGLSSDEENPAAIEKAAREQAQKIRERMMPAQADAAKTLMQEITRARAILLDPAKRTAYKASLKSGGGADPWWKQEVMPATRPTAGPAQPRPAAPSTASPAAEFSEIDDGIRRRRKKSGAPLMLLLLGGGGLLVAVAGAIAAVLMFGGSSTTTEQVKHAPTSNNNVIPL